MDPIEGWFWGISGNNFKNKGVTALVKSPIAPPLSPTRMIPSQRHIAPVRYNESSKPSLAEEALSELKAEQPEIKEENLDTEEAPLELNEEAPINEENNN